MFPRRFVIGALVALLVIGLLITGGSARERDTWMQGYLVGRLSAGNDSGETAQVLPYLYPGYAGGYRGPHFFGVFGLLLLFGLFFLLFAGGCRFFRHAGWHHYGGAEGGPHGRHGHRPPWWGWEERPQEPGQPGTGPQQGGGGGYA